MTDIPRVLLVDDNPNEGFLLEDALTSVGWPVSITHFHKLSDVVAQLRDQTGTEEFDMVLIDYNLPGSTLEQAIVEMQTLPSTRTAPIMVLSVISRDYDRDRLMRGGVKHVLVKPGTVGDYASFAGELTAFLPRAQTKPDHASTTSINRRSTSENHRPSA